MGQPCGNAVKEIVSVTFVERPQRNRVSVMDFSAVRYYQITSSRTPHIPAA
jgi:hypothetical protein